MALSHSPRIITDNLVCHIDPANSRSYSRGTNLLELSEWSVGTGSVGSFTMNGTIDENERVIDTNPFGQQAVVWQTPSNDVTSDADGGWNGSYIDIDNTKMYRFSTWIRKKVIGNGRAYLGGRGYDSSNVNTGVIYRSDGATVNTNSYFINATWNEFTSAVDEWYLFVGHTWPTGSGAGTAHSDSGIWSLSGTKLKTAIDYIWNSDNVKTLHRTYQYYSTTTTEVQQWYHPRLDVVDGTEPSLQDLLNNVGNERYAYDLNTTGSSLTKTTLMNGASYSSSNNGVFAFDGVDDYLIVGGNVYDLSTNNEFTVSIFVKSNTATWNDTGFLASKRNQFILHASSGDTGVDYYVNTASGWELVAYYPTDIQVFNEYTMTYNQGTLKAYFNGELVGSTSVNSSLSSDSGSIEIGKDETLERYGNMQAGPFKLYNRALSDSEVAQNYNAIKWRYV